MGYVVDIIALEHPKTEKYYAPKTQDTQPFFITEYGRTRIGIPCYQLRLQSPVSCVQYVVSGSGVIVTDTDVYPVQTGDTFLLPEGDTQIYYSNVDNRFERIWLNFKGTALLTCACSAKQTRKICFWICKIVAKITQIHKLIKTKRQSCF